MAMNEQRARELANGIVLEPDSERLYARLVQTLLDLSRSADAERDVAVKSVTERWASTLCIGCARGDKLGENGFHILAMDGLASQECKAKAIRALPLPTTALDEFERHVREDESRWWAERDAEGHVPNCNCQKCRRRTSLKDEKERVEAACGEAVGLLRELAVETGGFAHDDGCPEDDTCECSVRAKNDKLRDDYWPSAGASLLAERDSLAKQLADLTIDREKWVESHEVLNGHFVRKIRENESLQKQLEPSPCGVSGHRRVDWVTAKDVGCKMFRKDNGDEIDGYCEVCRREKSQLAEAEGRNPEHMEALYELYGMIALSLTGTPTDSFTVKEIIERIQATDTRPPIDIKEIERKMYAALNGSHDAAKAREGGNENG